MSGRWTDLDDERLLREAGQSPAAFGEFYRRHEKAVGSYFMRRTRSADLAADLTSETFATALIRRHNRRADSPPNAWLFTIANHIWLRSLNRQRVENSARERLGLRIEITDEVRDRFEELAGDQRAQAILDDLPAEQAEAIRHRVLDDASYESIALRLECSSSVVRKRVSRGLQTLRTRKDAL